MKVEREYNVLLDSGDLLDMFPGLSGEWELDKAVFKKLWEEQQRILKDIGVDYEEI